MIDREAVAADLASLVRVPSETGSERAAFERLYEVCGRRGLSASLVEHDLSSLRALPGWPGEEAVRSELVGLTASVEGSSERRLCLNGHLDVVGPGEVPWGHGGPWSGAVEDGFLYGRGSLDMKAGVIAAVHAMAAVPSPSCSVVLQAVSSEEDGGLGTFAALEQDDRFDACLIPEPTAFELVCAHGGALTFHGVVHGRAAHAAFRLAGESAIDRWVPMHAALAQLEREMNADVQHPLMRRLELPYPLLVGQVHAGRWSSVVPDRLEFEGRVGVPVGESPEEVRSMVERACAGAEITWTGGQFGSGAVDVDHPFVGLVRTALAEETGEQAPIVGVPYGADMRQYTERGIPCVMVGPGGLERVHGVDERVSLDEVVTLARLIARVIESF